MKAVSVHMATEVLEDQSLYAAKHDIALENLGFWNRNLASNYRFAETKGPVKETRQYSIFQEARKKVTEAKGREGIKERVTVVLVMG